MFSNAGGRNKFDQPDIVNRGRLVLERSPCGRRRSAARRRARESGGHVRGHNKLRILASIVCDRRFPRINLSDRTL
jgi:hypothetical protein